MTLEKPHFQLCLITDFSAKGLPVLRRAMGRLGIDNAPGDWQFPREDYFNNPKDERGKRHAAVFAPFVMLKLLGVDETAGAIEPLWERDTKSATLAKLFQNIGETLDSFHDLEKDFLSENKQDVFYQNIGVFCADIQKHVFIKTISPKGGLLRAVVAPAAGQKNKKTGFRFIPQSICRYSDIFIFDFKAACGIALNRGQDLDACLATFNDSNEDELKKWNTAIVTDRSKMTECFLALASCGIQSKCTITDPDRQEFAIIVGSRTTGFGQDAWEGAYIKNLQDYLARRVQQKSLNCLDIERIYGLQVLAYDLLTHQSQGAPIHIDNLIKDVPDRVVVITGQSGTGKSTSLRHLAWTLAEDFRKRRKRPPLPIYLECSSAAFSIQIVSMLAACGHVGLDEKQALDILSSHDCVFLIDGFDDLDVSVRNNPTELENLKIRFPKARFIIAGREGQISAIAQIQEYSVLKPENPTQCIMSHGIAEDIANRAISELKRLHADTVLTRPIFLGFVARLLKEDPNANLPAVPGVLMKRVFEDLYIPEMLRHPRMAKEYGLTVDEQNDVVNGLAVLAFRIIDENATDGFAAGRCEEILTSFFESKKRGNPTGDLAHNILNSVKLGGILEETPRKTFKFWHDMVRDYFAAGYIESNWKDKSTGCSPKELIEWLKWDNALILLCGSADEEFQRGCISVAAASDIWFAEALLSSSGNNTNESFIMLLVAQLIPMAGESSIYPMSAIRHIHRIRPPDWRVWLIGIIDHLLKIYDKEMNAFLIYCTVQFLEHDHPQPFYITTGPYYPSNKTYDFSKIPLFLKEMEAYRTSIDKEALRNVEHRLNEIRETGNDVFGWPYRPGRCDILRNEALEDLRSSLLDTLNEFEKVIGEKGLGITRTVKQYDNKYAFSIHYDTEVTVGYLLRNARQCVMENTRLKLGMALSYICEALVLAASGGETTEWLYEGMRHICHCCKTIGTRIAKTYMLSVYLRIRDASHRRLYGILPGVAVDCTDIIQAEEELCSKNLQAQFEQYCLDIVCLPFLKAIESKYPELAEKYRNNYEELMDFFVSNDPIIDAVAPELKKLLDEADMETMMRKIGYALSLSICARLTCTEKEAEEFFTENLQNSGIPMRSCLKD